MDNYPGRKLTTEEQLKQQLVFAEEIEKQLLVNVNDLRKEISTLQKQLEEANRVIAEKNEFIAGIREEYLRLVAEQEKEIGEANRIIEMYKDKNQGG